MTIGILLVHLSPNDLAPETYDFVDRLNRQTGARFIARHGWILAFGDIRRLLRSSTLAGWAARGSRFPICYLDDAPLLRQLNRYIKSQVRRHEKNRPGLWRRYRYRRPYSYPTKRKLRVGFVAYRRLSDCESFDAVAKRVVALLRSAVGNPAEVTVSAWYRRQYVPRMPGLGLRDFTELAQLSFGGVKQTVVRQYARHRARSVLSADIPLLVPTETQRVLERVGRLYKNSCWWSKKGPHRLFDSRAEAKDLVRLDPKKQEIATVAVRDIVTADPEISKRDIASDLGVSVSIVREAHQSAGGQVIVLIPGTPRRRVAAKRHAQLAAARESYNAQHGSYWNGAGLSRQATTAGTLIRNLENDFGRHNEIEVA